MDQIPVVPDSFPNFCTDVQTFPNTIPDQMELYTTDDGLPPAHAFSPPPPANPSINLPISRPIPPPPSDTKYKTHRVIRGIAFGPSRVRPPKIKPLPGHTFVPAKVVLINSGIRDLCLPEWTDLELQDRRRIIKIERYQIGAEIIANFSILSTEEVLNPVKKYSTERGISTVEVSCLECYVKPKDDLDDEDMEAILGNCSGPGFEYSNLEKTRRSFYITSVEVLKIVELLIGTPSQDIGGLRRERGRIRSNLYPFWSKTPVSSKVATDVIDPSQDFRLELGTRIMTYETRRPRAFDKEVRIMKWEKLEHALMRAFKSYYVEVPISEE